MLTVLLVCIAFGFILTKSYSIYQKNRETWKNLRNIPSPPSLPILGHALLFLGSPDKMFAMDRKLNTEYYPIYKLSLLHISTVTLLSPEDVEMVLSNTKHISKSSFYDFLHCWLGTGLLTSTGEKWQTRRKILTPAFHFNILQEFLNIFNDEINNLLGKIEGKCSADYTDVVPLISQFTLSSIAETAMGLTKNLKDQNQDQYLRAIHKMGNFVTYRTTRPWTFNDSIYRLTSNGKAQGAVIKTLHDYSRNVIEERRKQLKLVSSSDPTEKRRMAMLDLLLGYQAKGANIDEEGIREEVDTFMFEGHDTTSTSISYTLMLLANHREIQEEIYQELIEILGDKEENPTFSDLQNLRFMERCIKESLRLYPSVPFISRVTGEEIKTHTGHVIPKGCIVNIFIYDMHRNPRVFENPETFDPDRFLPENVQKRHPFAYIPFSAGPRNCIGQKFAILEIKAALCGILRRFILEPVDKPEDIILLADMVLRCKNGVRIKFAERK